MRLLYSLDTGRLTTATGNRCRRHPGTELLDPLVISLCVASAARRWRLTTRQRAVLQAVVEGDANATSAAASNTTERAVEQHVSALSIAPVSIAAWRWSRACCLHSRGPRARYPCRASLRRGILAVIVAP